VGPDLSVRIRPPVPRRLGPLARWLVVATAVAIVLAIGTSRAFPLQAQPLRWWFRKSIHVAEYAGLSLTLAWALKRPGERLGARQVSVAVTATVLVGCVDEWHQTMVPGRTALVSDVGIDALGAGLGQVLASVAARSGGPHARRVPLIP
jgi:VanZ family protein